MTTLAPLSPGSLRGRRGLSAGPAWRRRSISASQSARSIVRTGYAPSGARRGQVGDVEPIVRALLLVRTRPRGPWTGPPRARRAGARRCGRRPCRRST